MQKKFGKVTTVSRAGILNSKNSTDYGVFYDNSGELLLNLLNFANKKNALSEHAQKAQEMKKSGEWSSSHPLHIFRHEIGYAIQLEHKLNDPLWDDKLEKITEIMRSLPEFDYVNFTGAYSVSKYAMLRPGEFISECIAKSMMKKPGVLVNTVVKIIKGDD